MLLIILSVLYFLCGIFIGNVSATPSQSPFVDLPDDMLSDILVNHLPIADLFKLKQLNQKTKNTVERILPPLSYHDVNAIYKFCGVAGKPLLSHLFLWRSPASKRSPNLKFSLQNVQDGEKMLQCLNLAKKFCLDLKITNSVFQVDVHLQRGLSIHYLSKAFREWPRAVHGTFDTNLHLHINGLLHKKTISGLGSVLHGATRFPKLVEIDLSRNKIENWMLHSYLLKALSMNVNLEILNLSKNRLGPNGVWLIANVLRANSKIRSLDLSENQITNVGVEHLAQGLTRNPNLQVLGLNSCGIGPTGAISIAKILKNAKSLQILDLDFNEIMSDGAVTIAEALKTSKSLLELHLFGNQISDAGARALSRALMLKQELDKTKRIFENQEMNSCWVQSDQRIDAAEEDLFLNPVSEHTVNEKVNCDQDVGDFARHIKFLDISHNEIGPDGARELANAILHSSIRELDLSFNRIGDDGARELAKALRTKTNLENLHLKFNEIGPHGAHDLAEALLQNDSLQSLAVHYNNIGDTATAIFKTVARSKRVSVDL